MSAKHLKLLCLPVMLVVLMAVGCPMPEDQTTVDQPDTPSAVVSHGSDVTQTTVPDIAALMNQIHMQPSTPATNENPAPQNTSPSSSPPVADNPPAPPPASDPSASTPSATAFTLTSSAFANNGTIPQQYAGYLGVSPPLAWTGAPAGTKQFALIVDDPDGGTPPFVHWVIYDISGTTQSLPENISPYDFFSSKWDQGTNDFQGSGYGGPQPPQGDAAHHYHFTLYALDTVLDLQSGLTRDDVLNAISGHVLDHAELVGLYAD